MAVKEWFRQLQPVQLYLVLFFTSTFFIIEIIASHVTHSLTLLLNAYHMLCNIVALVGCIASVKYGKQDKCRRDRNSKDSIICIKENENPSASESKHSCSDSRMKNTFGWARIDILTMLMCCVLLASFCFSLLVEALQTLIHIDHLDEMHHPVPVMCIGNATDEQRLANPTRRSPLAIPRRQGFQEMCRDVLGCILVVVNSLLVYLTDAHLAKFFDPIFAIISSVSLFALSYPYLRESGLILLQTIPNHINIDSLKKELLAAFPGIVNVHDFHVWQLAGEKIVSTIHIIFLDQTVYSVIIDQVTAFFTEMGITHVTIQPEFQKMKEVSKSDCLIRCRGKRCIESQCCSKDDLLDEVILDKSDKIINKKFLRKEIIPSEEDVNLKKFTLLKSDSTKSMNVSLKDTEKISVSKPSRDHRNSCPDGNVSVINVDVNSVRADPCENVKK
ncbi:Similar to Slc30a1: Zinc transporter 1 (Rattus norvegicus) [Cotesia congregata]|uniref:Similar to Slc30a1: Zinc transporter 1 (Rattus norvegicus) n=1 Tax=Cotesia congregata TaxID=51543 RepID=A0A8J2H623_COTCN|nr:Similar to Slc30a1: Zinc transporter 1 (Rattus norvegicus) [Cotesia congregata]